MKSNFGTAKYRIPFALVVLWACGADEESARREARANEDVTPAATEGQEAKAQRAKPDFSVAGLTDREVEGFLDSLKAAVANDDRQAVAAMVRYPIRVRLDGSGTMVASADDFVRRYPDIMTDHVRGSVLAQEVAELFVNWQGVMVGQGEVWFSAVYDDPRDDDAYELKVIAINNQR